MYRTVVRKALYLPSRTHNTLLPLLTGTLPLEAQIHKRKLVFLYKCIHGVNTYVSWIAKIIVQSHWSSYGRHLRDILMKYHINDSVINDVNMLQNQVSCLQ